MLKFQNVPYSRGFQTFATCFLSLSVEATLGTRGFSYAVSGFGQVLKSDPPNTCGPVTDEAPRPT